MNMLVGQAKDGGAWGGSDSSSPGSSTRSRQFSNPASMIRSVREQAFADESDVDDSDDDDDWDV